MNDFLISFVLGIVEGLTEFLPISSTAHLRIVEALFGFNLQDSFWKMYTIVIQLGAILALPVYFGTRILTYLATFPHGERGDRTAFAARFWGDGTPRLTAYEYQGLLQSRCARKGALTCTTCHGMHEGDPRGQLRAGLRGAAADQMCTRCHSTLAERSAAILIGEGR